MICPKCHAPRMDVTNRYAAGDDCATTRLQCPRCRATATCVSMLLHTDPCYGEGASAVAAALAAAPEVKEAARGKLVQHTSMPNGLASSP